MDFLLAASVLQRYTAPYVLLVGVAKGGATAQSQPGPRKGCRGTSLAIPAGGAVVVRGPWGWHGISPALKAKTATVACEPELLGVRGWGVQRLLWRRARPAPGVQREGSRSLGVLQDSCAGGLGLEAGASVCWMCVTTGELGQRERVLYQRLSSRTEVSYAGYAPSADPPFPLPRGRYAKGWVRAVYSFSTATVEAHPVHEQSAGRWTQTFFSQVTSSHPEPQRPGRPGIFLRMHGRHLSLPADSLR